MTHHDYIHVATRPVPQAAFVPAEGPRAWYVAMTNPRCEHRAQSGLIDKGFAVYLPQYRMEKTIKRTGHKKIINRTLFPRYMFVSARFGSWPSITATDGIQGLVREFGMSGRPMTVSDGAIQTLIERQNAGDFDFGISKSKRETKVLQAAGKIKAPFDEGGRVFITDGPFTQFFATVVEALAGHHAIVLVRMFGTETKATIPIADLQAA